MPYSITCFLSRIQTPSKITSKRTTPFPQRERGISAYQWRLSQSRKSKHFGLFITAAGISALMGTIAKAIDQMIQCTVDSEHRVTSLLNLEAGIKSTYHPAAVKVVNPDSIHIKITKAHIQFMNPLPSVIMMSFLRIELLQILLKL